MESDVNRVAKLDIAQRQAAANAEVVRHELMKSYENTLFGNAQAFKVFDQKPVQQAFRRD